MKFLLVALFATVVCTASADSILKELLSQAKDMKHGMDKAVIEKVKCHIDAITSAVQGTEHAQKWKVIADEASKMTENIVKCVKDNHLKPIEAAKCVAEEVTKIRSIVKDFVESLKKDNTEIYNKIKEGIKKC